MGENYECENVLSLQVKNPDFDAEDYILEQNKTINELADIIKSNIEGYKITLNKLNEMAAAYQAVKADNGRLQAFLIQEGYSTDSY